MLVNIFFDVIRKLLGSWMGGWGGGHGIAMLNMRKANVASRVSVVLIKKRFNNVPFHFL